MALRAISRAAQEAGFVIATEAPSSLAPFTRLVIVAEVVNQDDILAARSWKDEFPSAYLVGFLEMPKQSLWLAAERAGFDLVCSRGSVGPALRKVLGDDTLTSTDRAIAVCNSADIAGRLGHLMDLELESLGAISLWRVEGRVLCTGRCPHQRVSLASGEIDGSVVTCPAHGSRFDLISGERMRGPSDFDLACYGTYEENGRVWVLPKR